MNKSLVIGLYGIALFVILRKYYAEGNSGMPNPKVLANPTYLYGMLLLASDVVGGLPIILALGLTVALVWQANAQKAPIKNAYTTGQKKTG